MAAIKEKASKTVGGAAARRAQGDLSGGAVDPTNEVQSGDWL
jgi:hypothetical protein